MRSTAGPVDPTLSAGERGEIDLGALFREVGRRKWTVLIATALGFGLSLAAVNVVSPRYTAETRVFLENRDSEYTRIGRDGARDGGAMLDADAVLSQVQIITSRDIARNVIERFNLGSKPEFDPVLKGIDPVMKFAVMLGLVNNPANISPQERVLENYFDKLKAFSMAKSRVIAVEFQSKDPELAAKLSSAIAEEYIRQLEQAKRGTALNAGSWLSRTIEDLRQRVNAAEQRVEAFRTANGLFVSRETQSISTQQLSELNAQLAASRSQQVDLANRARQLREAIRQGRIFEISEINNNDVVRRLIENRATLMAQIAQEERTLLPQHPRIKELQAQLGGLESQIRAAAERAARTLESDARAAASRVAANQAELDMQKRTTGSSNEQEVQLRALEREARAEREQLENFLSRYRDAAVREADNAVVADARIVSRATVPSIPSFPKRIPIVIIATLGMFTISLFWILTRALLSDRIYTRRAPEPMHAGLPPMMPGMMPYPWMMMPGMMPQMAGMPPGMVPTPAHPAQYGGMAAPAPSSDPGLVDPARPKVDPLEGAMSRMRSAMSQSTMSQSAVTQSAAPTVKPPAVPAESVTPRPAPLPSAAPVAPHRPPSPPAPAIAVPPPVPPLPVTPKAKAPSVAPDMDALIEPLAPPSAPARPDVASVPSIRQEAPAPAGYDNAAMDAVKEVAEEAEAMKIHGRPVSLLVTAVHGGTFGAATLSAIEQALAGRGKVQLLRPGSGMTVEGVTSAVKDMGKDADYLLIDAGAAGPLSSPLSRATTMTVLIAPNDVNDKASEAATQWLQGCNYFIVGAVDEPLGAA